MLRQETTHSKFLVSIVLIIVAFYIGGVVGTLYPIWKTQQVEVEELGQAICEMESGMDFESYENYILNCKPKAIPYDGIKIRINSLR